MAGEIEVNGELQDKPGAAVKEEARLDVRAREPFVSRAGRKLAAALDHFALDPAGKVCVDVGASTGGFTDCLLQRGALRVHALDVGYGQLDARLRGDPRVVVMERFNARFLTPDVLPERPEFAVIDVSFISLLKIVPAVLTALAADSTLVALIKPQFEAGRAQIGKGGIVRDESIRKAVIAERVVQLSALGLELIGSIDSPVAGMEGNREALAAWRWPGAMSRETA